MQCTTLYCGQYFSHRIVQSAALLIGEVARAMKRARWTAARGNTDYDDANEIV